jgi:catechol 2,3-dioxygenase-like lactoylglutathione lyase family enzyme
MSTVSVRCIVDDVDAAIAVYRDRLGFDQVMHPDPAFAMLNRGDLRLVLVSTIGPDHRGWNRFMLEVEDLEAIVAELRSHGARFRNQVVAGVGGKQILLEDPFGSPIELFQPTCGEARLSG